MTERDGSTRSTVQCESERQLAWLREVLAEADGVNVDIVVQEAAGARSSVQITLHDVPGPLAGLPLRKPA